jgi:hypothetical protein
MVGLLSTFFALRAMAGEVVLPAPGSPGWEHLRFPTVDRATEYRVLPDEGVVHAVSRCAASALVLPLDGIDPARTPLLRWRWRIVRLPSVDDERKRSGDDFAARVYVIFPFDPERSSPLTRLRRLFAEKVLGRRLPGSAINYVQTAHEPAAARWDNPYTEESKMISVGQGTLAEWTTMEVDLRSGHKATFGGAPPSPSAIALMTDADDSCSEAEAWFADLRFREARDPAP